MSDALVHAPQKPTSGEAPKTAASLLAIAQHPAVRLGFLDAQAGKPIDHDDIIGRIWRETPERALERIGWRIGILEPQQDVALAQFRYEEGRMLVVDAGLRCRGWGHPDYPPASLRRWAMEQEKCA